MAHSVARHLHIEIADYDRFIRTVIPGYEAMRGMQLDLLARCLPPAGRVLDLGGGTGALAAAVAEKFSEMQVEIWDTDPAMLAVARARCAEFGSRVSYVERSFTEPLPACDAVVACIALHHIKDLAVKGKIYTHIHCALRSGGLFANADCTMSTRPWLRDATFQSWAKFLGAQGIGERQAQQYFAEWAKEDYYPPLATEFTLLKDAGFPEPECFWQIAPFGVFGGIKS
ncbi:MAG: class I SAM-dependent methyltransferase [Opitutaceae bacterium]